MRFRREGGRDRRVGPLSLLLLSGGKSLDGVDHQGADHHYGKERQLGPVIEVYLAQKLWHRCWYSRGESE
jgi:hypothetical protein